MSWQIRVLHASLSQANQAVAAVREEMVEVVGVEEVGETEGRFLRKALRA